MSYNNLFEDLRLRRRKALITYFTALYPSAKAFESAVLAADRSGSDLIEIGLPFSDPMADGPVIQHSSHCSLVRGFTISRMFRSLARLKGKVSAPLIIMTYFNPVLKRGIKRFIGECRLSGVSGLIIPDMLPEEGGPAEEAAARAGIAINYLLAPDSGTARIRLVAARTTGFIYLVSAAGVTGERKKMPGYLPRVAARIRRITDKPLCIGFGISTPQQAKAVSGLCDGVIVGSALVKKTGPGEAAKFIKALRRGIGIGAI